jgi:hypothetical protein
VEIRCQHHDSRVFGAHSSARIAAAQSVTRLRRRGRTIRPDTVGTAPAEIVFLIVKWLPP